MQRLEGKPTQDTHHLPGFARKTSKQEARVVFDTRQAQRIHQLGGAVTTLTMELAKARHELSALQAENVVLRKRLGG
jgi:hypothetical protein